ncbi:hypothetical protein CHS0354_018906 [Potamilus streckersoni]|uniref:Uncharacterized protein n=1 Tax=Potamilus streckersoni TaxID=2493646 RepID=A0AAE0SBW4_9BIVA|nr:hypothetical protein CHS0354_018906 [Potamilus streckersoni]
MAQKVFLISRIVVSYIFTECSFTIAFICGDPANISSLVAYGKDLVCCNYTLHKKIDVQGRERDCCGGKHLFYRDTCACNTNSQLESFASGFPLDLCLVTVSKPSQPDITKMSSSSLKVPANIENEGCQSFYHKHCIHTRTCFDPLREICCPDGVFKGRKQCPSLETNSKFCTDNERLDKRNMCAKKYKHGYHISFGKTIAQANRYIMFNVTVSEIMPDANHLLPSSRFAKLKIDASGGCHYTLIGTTFTVFSAKKLKWNADSYFYLDKDDFVLRKNIRKKHFININKKCKESAQKHGKNTDIDSVSKSGDQQLCRTHISLTIQFLLCFGVYFSMR